MAPSVGNILVLPSSTCCPFVYTQPVRIKTSQFSSLQIKFLPHVFRHIPTPVERLYRWVSLSFLCPRQFIHFHFSDCSRIQLVSYLKKLHFLSSRDNDLLEILRLLFSFLSLKIVSCVWNVCVFEKIFTISQGSANVKRNKKRKFTRLQTISRSALVATRKTGHNPGREQVGSAWAISAWADSRKVVHYFTYFSYRLTERFNFMTMQREY